MSTPVQGRRPDDAHHPRGRQADDDRAGDQQAVERHPDTAAARRTDERTAGLGHSWWHPRLQLTGLLVWGLGMLLGPRVANPTPTTSIDLSVLRSLEPLRSHPLIAIARGIELWDGPVVTPWLLLAALVIISLFHRKALALCTVLLTALSWLPGHIAKTPLPS